MCWCWSEQARQRPSFQQILQVLKSESFTNLLAAAQLMDPIPKITAACTSIQSLPLLPTTPSDISPSFKKIMKLLHNDPSRASETVQVWYGTQNGRVEMLQFQSSVTTKKVNINMGTFIKRIET